MSTAGGEGGPDDVGPLRALLGGPSRQGPLDVGRDPGGTIRDAERERDKLRSSVADETFVEPDKLTTGEWFTRWLDGRRASLRPRTAQRYASLLRVHVLPAVGHVPLQKLSASDLDRCYAAMLVNGHQRAKGTPLSAQSVRFAVVCDHSEEEGGSQRADARVSQTYRGRCRPGTGAASGKCPHLPEPMCRPRTGL